MPVYGGHGPVDVVAEATASRTLTVADNGKMFTNLGGGACTFTLPLLSTLHKGWTCRFFVQAAGDFIVAAHATDADKIACFNDAAADSVAFSTDNEEIGGSMVFTVDSAGTGWLCETIGGETQTPVIATA